MRNLFMLVAMFSAFSFSARAEKPLTLSQIMFETHQRSFYSEFVQDGVFASQNKILLKRDILMARLSSRLACGREALRALGAGTTDWVETKIVPVDAGEGEKQRGILDLVSVNAYGGTWIYFSVSGEIRSIYKNDLEICRNY